MCGNTERLFLLNTERHAQCVLVIPMMSSVADGWEGSVKGDDGEVGKVGGGVGDGEGVGSKVGK